VGLLCLFGHQNLVVFHWDLYPPPRPNQALVDQGGFAQALIVVLPKKKTLLHQNLKKQLVMGISIGLPRVFGLKIE